MSPRPERMDSEPPVHPGWVPAAVRRWNQRQAGAGGEEAIAEEVPLALLFNGKAQAVMLGTPRDLEDFAVGFSLTESLVESVDEISAIEVQDQPEGIEIRLRIPDARQRQLADRERTLAGRTGCGLCGVRALAAAVRVPEPVKAEPRVGVDALQRALAALPEAQSINAVTGAVHAAAWVTLEGHIVLVREDVGRHNALDKLLGALAREGRDTSQGFVLVTSRASYEMVQKAASRGVAMLVAVSAPTSMAVRIAELSRLTLVGFARSGRHTVYTHPYRLQAGPLSVLEGGAPPSPAA